MASAISAPAVLLPQRLAQYAAMVAFRLKQARVAKGMKQDELAERMGVEPPTISRWENGHRKPDLDQVQQLAQLLNVTVADLFDEPLKSEVAPAPMQLANPTGMHRDVPVYGTALAADAAIGANGHSIMVEATMLEPTQTLAYVNRPPALSGRRDIYALYVVGSSMEPRFRPGERVYVDPRRPPSIGDDVIVQLRDDDGDDGELVVSALIKTLVRRTAEGLQLEQYNPAQSFFVHKSRYSAVHRVVPWNELLGD